MTLYSEPLPLRTTAVWEGFRTAEPLPHRFGATGGKLIQYSADRRTFLWADHPCLSVDEVFIGEVATSAWTWRNAVDSTGQAVCLVELEHAPDEGADLRAYGRGKLSTARGALIECPSEVLYDLLANIAGKPVTTAMLDPFRRECEALGLTVAGSFDDASVTVQGAAREVCASVGASFAPDAFGLAFVADASAALTGIDIKHSATFRAELGNLVNDLTVNFDFDGSEPRQAIRMEAPASVETYGRRQATLDARWLASARVASIVTTRSLQRSARPAWRASVDNLKRRLRVGDSVALDHPLLPITGTYRILARSIDVESDVSSVSFDVPAGPAPSVTLVRQSSRLGPQSQAESGVTLVGDDYEIRLVEDNGAPIAQAAVTLNSATTRLTDGNGVVRFPSALWIRARDNRLDVKTVDGRTFVQQVGVP